MALVVCEGENHLNGREIVYNDGAQTMQPVDCPVCELEAEVGGLVESNNILEDEVTSLQAEITDLREQLETMNQLPPAEARHIEPALIGQSAQI